jgi:hypothetical protein
LSCSAQVGDQLGTWPLGICALADQFMPSAL